ncbi:signal peptidase I [Ileibacterium valens]|uniref:Signal peptidase I n=1 Tax=Ileibacterium valens TaxID=1862668 RepID=A0A1U7NHB8_9FIRM|nr:signal peptidase I [Ileibacterium valens]OLU36242.1 signal peptidase I [Erysipelotrichaceae bacterium NYU-BL-E8]OLU37168.1 signal peptidase I [Erysipelotrichaceae bacterium NYU-BL-F16]OLU41032.1 signal peptidase I [Ileibacterium valens]
MSEENTKRKKRKQRYSEDDERSIWEDILDFVKVFAISAIVILLFVNFIAYPITVRGHSMDPTLSNGEYGYTSLISLSTSEPARGDIVVVKMNEEDGSESLWVKRVIGLPGETVECKDGIIYINGVAFDESDYLSEEYMSQALADFKAETGYDYGTFTNDFAPVTLGEDQYWIMGDNRPWSKDSRDPGVGAVSRDRFFGKGIMVLWPFDKFGAK